MGDARGVELLLGARAQVECTTLVLLPLHFTYTTSPKTRQPCLEAPNG